MKQIMKAVVKTALPAALVLAMILGLTACGSAPSGTAAAADAAAAPGSASGQEGITVSASASVRLVPDKASVSFGVTTQERTAEAAQAGNTEAVNHVIDVLTGRGVAETSIRTTYYNMYPQYDYSSNGSQRIIGYVVTTSMTVQDQDIADLGELLSACVAAGINSVDSIRLLCSGYDEAYRQALAQAVEDARQKAEALAAAAGRSLGAAVAVTEGWQDTSARYGAEEEAVMSMDMAAAEADGGALNIQPGETEINANVTVTFAMN